MRFYRALLLLYPKSFRNEYGRELCAAFADRMKEFTGVLAPVMLVLAAVSDVVPNAVAVHWDILRQDLRYGAQTLVRAPGFSVTAILVVALGVGVNTAAFSLADFILLRPLPFPESDRLVKLWQSTPGYGTFELSPPNYRDWQAMTRTVEGMSAYNRRGVNMAGHGEPRRVDGAVMTPGLFPLLGIPAFAGRTFTAADSVDERLVVLSHAFWQTHFGGDTRVINSSVRINDEPFTIIGVMPPAFRFPDRNTQLWMPLFLREDDFADRNNNYLEGVARLRPGVSLASANREFTDITVELERQFPAENRNTRALILGMLDELPERARLLVVAITGAALCILLLACANLASLVVARASYRARELAVRAALGAGRERLVRQLVTESLLLSAVGGVVGVAAAAGTLPLLARLVPTALPVAEQPSVDLRVLVVAGVLVVATALLFGVGPAIGAGRTSGLAALRAGARGGSRTRHLRSTLVVLELVASVVLLISSGLLLRAALRIQATDPGFQPAGVLALRTTLAATHYELTARRELFYDGVLNEVRQLPGVQSAAYATGLPMDMRGGIWPVSVAGQEERTTTAANSVAFRVVTAQFFSTLGIPILEGRDVAPFDTRAQSPVAIVSASFAQRHWPGRSALGERFTVAFDERTVVGVVADVRVRGLERTSEPQVYVPSAQMRDSSLIFYRPRELVVRASVDQRVLVPRLREIIARADPDQPVSHVRPLVEIVADETAPRVVQLRLLGALSLIALLIAGLGVHGLLSYTVSQRGRELGVRRALGEPVQSIVKRVLGEGMMLALVGVAVGSLAGYLAARGMGALLAGVRADDPMTIAVAAALCFTTAAVGCLRPALRAARTDPIAALRGE